VLFIEYYQLLVFKLLFCAMQHPKTSIFHKLSIGFQRFKY